MNKVELSVPDISCAHCERAIVNALTPVAGIEQVVVDIPTRRVHLAYDPAQVDLEAVKAILQEEEYPVAAVAPGA